MNRPLSDDNFKPPYIVVESGGIAGLSMAVSEKMAEGYTPQGSVVWVPGRYALVQPMMYAPLVSYVPGPF